MFFFTTRYKLLFTLGFFGVSILFLLFTITPKHKLLAKEGTDDDKKLKERQSLQIPAALWKDVLKKVGFEGKTLGYTDQEMKHFPSDENRIDFIYEHFQDALKLPETSAAFAQGLMQSNSSLGQASEVFLTPLFGSTALQSTEQSEFTSLLPGKKTWGAQWAPEEADTQKAFEAIVNFCQEQGVAEALSEEHEKNWSQLPEDYQRLVVRLVFGSLVASEYFTQAYDYKFFKNNVFSQAQKERLFRGNLQDLALAPWKSARAHPDAIKALQHIDLKKLGFGVSLYLAHLDFALQEFQTAKPKKLKQELRFELNTPIGSLLLGRFKEYQNSNKYAIVIEAGEDTHYTKLHSSKYPFEAPISTLLDLYGDDQYEGRAAYGCFSLSVLRDLEGDDKYTCKGPGLGCGFFGAGLLMDHEGNDHYSHSKLYGQGVGLAGLGLLADLKGDDTYECGAYAQGLGLTGGIGILFDQAGADAYKASDDTIISEAYGNRPLSMSQGCGTGRRADFGDGKSLSGGLGGLVDGGGDDTYYANIFSQGMGYWWGYGFLEDLGGDDSYRGLWYAQGIGAHFALGNFSDLSGNDSYNNDAVVSQVLGNGRDASIGVFFDGSGDDSYVIPNRAAGEGDLNGIGLFWDRQGKDTYRVQGQKPLKRTPCIGATSTEKNADKGFRGKMPTIGVFLDTGGEDNYDGTGYLAPKKQTSEEFLAKNNHEWFHNNQFPLVGFGVDNEEFSDLKEE